MNLIITATPNFSGPLQMEYERYLVERSSHRHQQLKITQAAQRKVQASYQCCNKSTQYLTESKVIILTNDCENVSDVKCNFLVINVKVQVKVSLIILHV